MIFELFFISVFTLYEHFQTTMTSYPTLKHFFHGTEGGDLMKK